MKLSLKVEYSCRVLAQLGRTYGSDRLMHIEELARAEEVPSNYLVQILNEMRNAGLIESRRGKAGGYKLARKPDEITLFDVLEAMEGDLLESRVQSRGESGPRVALVWQDITAAFVQQTRAIKLPEFMPAEPEKMY